MRIRIHRESRFCYSARQMQISANGTTIATLANGEEKVVDLPAGNYGLQFQIGGKTCKFLSVSDETNDEIFISCWCDANGSIDARSTNLNVRFHPEPARGNSTATIAVVVCVVLVVLLALLSRIGFFITFRTGESTDVSTTQQGSQSPITPHMIQPGEVFEQGAYILFEDVKISIVDGTTFLVENNREDIVLIAMAVVGIKTDGEYELLQMPSFSGVDEQAYAEDLEENGWAVYHYTNKVRPHQSLTATAQIFDFGSQDWPAPDIDGDGYYDIVFYLYPNQSEGGISVSTAAPESAAYKLKAD